MILKHSLALFINNINLTFKAMLYRLIVTLLFGVSAVLVVKYNLSVITKSAEAAAFLSSVKGAFIHFIGGEYSFAKKVSETYGDLVLLVKAHMSSVIGVAVFVSALLWIQSFLLGISRFAMMMVVDSHMSTISKRRFIEALVSSLKVSLPFEAVFTAIKTVVYLLIFTVSLLFISFTIEYLSVVSIMIAVMITIFLFSLFLTATSLVRPSVVSGVGLKAALKAKPTRRQYWTNVATYALAFTVAVVFNLNVFFFTFGAGIVISFPVTDVLFACIGLVLFYEMSSKKYYIDYDTIVTPKLLREDGELLDKVDM